MHRVMCDSPYQAAALLPDTESLPPGGIGGRLSKGHIDYDPFAATLDCLTQAMQTRNICTVSYRAALHRQEKTRQYASLRLLAYRESLFVQGYMVGASVRRYDPAGAASHHGLPRYRTQLCRPAGHPRTVRRGAGHHGNGRRTFRSQPALCPGGRHLCRRTPLEPGPALRNA